MRSNPVKPWEGGSSELKMRHAEAGPELRLDDEDWTSPQALRQEIEAKLVYSVGKTPTAALPRDWLTAAILTVRDRIIDRWMASVREAKRSGRKRVYYLSLEFLIGRLFEDAAGNMGLREPLREALALVGLDFDEIAALEPDAALGNGGLGRLAACFMESMATLGVSGLGYGIRYDHGLFKQKIVDGKQVETPEDWLNFRNPWEFLRPEIFYDVAFGGETFCEAGPHGVRHGWRPAEKVVAVAYDTPIVGWRGETVNTLRLWSAKAVDPIELETFNGGDHVGAIFERSRAESISRVLYPSDSTPAGQELRLKQEYFFASASLQDLIRRHIERFGDVRSLHEKAAIQLNDTHPAISVAELMRLLVDIHGLTWDEAWTITQSATSYTNHTLLPEALECWPVELMARLLPRHLEIIYEINQRFLDHARARGVTDNRIVAGLSIIDENHGRRVRMGNLAFVGAHKINGVSALHTNLMKETVFRDLNALYPGRIVNKTNGVTPRRWLLHCNPGLTELLLDCVGPKLLDNIECVSEFAHWRDDAAVLQRFSAVKQANKARLANYILEATGIVVDPQSLFDVHVKRIHEYKRQLLNILETVALYQAMRADPHLDWAPRVKIFAGKAAASYVQAKSIIHLINSVARVVNADPLTRDRLKVVFLANFNVSLAEVVVPAADLSEQISTAGMEASGTGNMKFALNGAITIGTLDGANVEIRERVGDDNIVIFGMNAQQVSDLQRRGYRPADFINASPRLRNAIEAIERGDFSEGDGGMFAGLCHMLRNGDHFMTAADFDMYENAQRHVDLLWRDENQWRRMALLNTANMGWFSSDRTIREYAEDIWSAPIQRLRQ